MLHLVLGFFWHSFMAQVGVTGLVLAGAVATYIYVPLPGVRHIAVSTAAVCCVLLFLGPKLYLEGMNHEKAKWTAAEARARQMGDAAKADALRDAASGVKDPFDSDQ